MMYLVKTPPLIKTIFSDFVWNVDTQDKVVYLTFDDGPIPEMTPWVLDQLHKYDFKATFFCVGDNIRKYPEIYQEILLEGHSIGNHTYHHINGWNTDHQTYLHDVSLCDNMMSTTLFRPPYGKLRPSQSTIIKADKTVVMWDVLSGDFDQSITPEKCLNNVLDNFENGSIIVFHDNIKAAKNLQYALPRFLAHLHEQGYQCHNMEALTMEFA